MNAHSLQFATEDLNGFEIIILFYILHDRVSEVSDWN